MWPSANLKVKPSALHNAPGSKNHDRHTFACKMRIKSSSIRQRIALHYKLAIFFPLLLASTFFIGRESHQTRNIRRQWSQDQLMVSLETDYITYKEALVSSPKVTRKDTNQYTISPGELPGYTGWSRPEQTLAGYFDVASLSHPPVTSAHTKYHSITKSGDVFSLLLTCNHNRTDGMGAEFEPPYECPQSGGTLFYVRAYGPSVITGIVTDFLNSSYSVEMRFIDPGSYTLEVVVTFSAPIDFDEFPLNGDIIIEPGYEGYMVSNFPLQILVESSSPSTEDVTKPWCTLAQLTESSPESALYKGHWQVIDNVAHPSHRPLTPDETTVSLDGYRMGLNSIGVRMRYVYEDCVLIHIRDLLSAISGGMDRCLHEQLGFNIHIGGSSSGFDELSGNISHAAHGIASSSTVNQALKDIFEGVHVIFIGDSVMRLVRFFFLKLISGSRGFKVTFIETNGGIHATMHNITATLEEIQRREESTNVKRVILFNSGLHDIDILCSSKRSKTRSKKNVMSEAVSCQYAYRAAMTNLVRVLDEYPAELKVFRSTTAGWHKYGNYGFSWPASDMQPMSRSPHLVHHFNTIAYDIIQKQSSNIHIVDGYWLTLPRPDHTQTSSENEVGKHMVHPGFEVLSVFARMWFMLIFWGLCGNSFESCMACIGGRTAGVDPAL